MSIMAALRLWREGAIGALLIALALLWIGKGMTERQNVRLKSELGQAEALIEQERALARSRAAQAKAEDQAHAARVERDQDRVSKEVSNDYQIQLGDLRRRYDALRLHAAAPAADPDGGGAQTMPPISVAARGADGAAGEDRLPAADALIASEQALRLKALQDWVRGQEAVER